MRDEELEGREDESAARARVRVLGVCACLAGGALLERSLLDDVAFFAVGAVLVGVGFCAIRFPGLFWSPRSLTRESPPCRPACASRENPRDRRDDEGTRTHLSR